MARHVSPLRNPKDLAKFGPRIEIQVGLPIVRNPGRLPDLNPTKFSKMPALIDTGAGRTVLTPEAVRKLDLRLVDYTTISRVGGKDKVGVYVASIQFPNDRLGTIEVIEVACCELPEQPIQCLLGRDILSHWLFTYNGKTGEWVVEEEDLVPWIDPPEGTLT